MCLYMYHFTYLPIRRSINFLIFFPFFRIRTLPQLLKKDFDALDYLGVIGLPGFFFLFLFFFFFFYYFSLVILIPFFEIAFSEEIIKRINYSLCIEVIAVCTLLPVPPIIFYYTLTNIFVKL